MLDWLLNLVYQIINPIPNILIALLLLVIAFVVAIVVKNLMAKLLKKFAFKKLGDKADAVKKGIAKAVSLIVFVLFLPTILSRLGLNSVSSPISDLINVLVNYIPYVVSAGIILAIGLFIAKAVRDLLLPLMKLTKIDTLQKKVGIEVTEKNALSTVIVNAVYAFILLIVITCALDSLRIPAISQPLNNIVGAIFGIVPELIGALVVIIVGLFVAKLAGNLLESLLAGIGTDKLTEKICGKAGKVSLSKIIATVVKVVVSVIVVVQGLSLLGLPVFVQTGDVILSYIPMALSVILILAAGMFAAKAAEAAVKKAKPEAKLLPIAAKAVIYVVVGFVVLSQLNIANRIVENTFLYFVGAVAVAFAVAFGIGGKTFAGNVLAKLEEKINK